MDVFVGSKAQNIECRVQNVGNYSNFHASYEDVPISNEPFFFCVSPWTFSIRNDGRIEVNQKKHLSPTLRVTAQAHRRKYFEAVGRHVPTDQV